MTDSSKNTNLFFFICFLLVSTVLCFFYPDIGKGLGISLVVTNIFGLLWYLIMKDEDDK